MQYDFSSLLDQIYEGILAAVPWQRFAEGLRAALEARNVFITLHHDHDGGQDVFVSASEPECSATTGPSSAPFSSSAVHCQSAVPSIRKS